MELAELIKKTDEYIKRLEGVLGEFREHREALVTRASRPEPRRRRNLKKERIKAFELKMKKP